MPRGPKGERRPADPIARDGQIEETFEPPRDPKADHVA